MAEPESNLRDMVRELTEEEERTLEQRPSLEMLGAFLDGELPDKEMEELREILSVDRASARTARELAALNRLEEGSGPKDLSSDELAEDLGRLKARIGSRSDGGRQPQAVATALPPSVESRLRFYRAATFLLGLSLLGLTARSFWFVAEAPAVTRVQDAVLKPLDTEIRGAEPAEIFIEVGSEHLYLTLLFVDVEAHKQLSLRILDPAREAFSEHALGVEESGPLTLQMREDLLPDGPVLFELYGEPGHRFLARYRARISRGPSTSG